MLATPHWDMGLYLIGMLRGDAYKDNSAFAGVFLVVLKIKKLTFGDNPD